MSEMKSRAASFDDADVARCYAYRPPYAPALYELLLYLVPRKHMLVDLGCGPGKIAAALADRFDDVVAIDPAAAMIDTARALHAHPNIAWRQGSAEDAELPGIIDLVTAGTSMYGLTELGGLVAGESVVVIGPGPIGLLAVAVAKALGASPVILT